MTAIAAIQASRHRWRRM